MSEFDEVSGYRTQFVVKLLVLAIVVGVVYLWRPLFHAVIYRIAYSPGALIGVGIPIVLGIVLYLAPPLKTETDSSSYGTNLRDEFSPAAKLTVFGVILVLFLILGAFVGGIGAFYEERALATETMAAAESSEEFPAMNEQNPRIVPRAVADTQTRGSVSYRQHELGTSDIARMEDGRLAWSYAIQPDPFRVKLQGHQRGVLLSDMTAMDDREMRAYDEHEYVHGQAMFLHRSADWNMKKDGGYWSQYRDDPIEFAYDDETYMVFPKTGHEWRFLPVPHTVPVWDGVALVHEDGTIEHLSPDEAQEHEALQGQRMYPLYNADRRASSLHYRNGISNALPIIGSYEGVVEPASMPAGAGNSQPFVVDLEGEEMSYVMAMEPYGEETRGLDEVWFFSAETGEMRYYETGRETLLGPERATGIVRSEDSRTDWGSNFEVVEPIPVVIDDELWWHSKVVPTDRTDVTRNVFVNAHRGTAIEFSETDGVIDFMSGEDVENIDDAEEVGEGESGGGGESAGVEPSEDEDVAYYVVVYDEEGNEVDRIPVEEGQESRIETGGSGQQATATPTDG